MNESRDALLDRLLAAYADRVAAGRGQQRDDLLEQVPAEHRGELLRLFALVEVDDEDGSRTPIVPLRPGLVLRGCRLIEEIGQGGMATVWRAEQLELKRDVAIKILRPGLGLDPRQAQRFRREALAIARIDDRHVVRIHEVGREQGHLFLVMEYVDGGSLAHHLARLPPPAQRGPDHDERAFARLFATVARALAVAHAHGIVHRDIKPSNLLLRRDGTPVIADFGLAKGDGDLARSLTGAPLGTPYYMSPEQVEQAQSGVDARSDVYSLGVTLYEALAGRPPRHGATTLALFDAIRHQQAPALRTHNLNCSAAAAAVVAKAMARRPEERYASAEAFAADLEALAQGRPVAAGVESLRSMWRRGMQAVQRGESFEWSSARAWRGAPLLHVAFGASAAPRTARGVVAIGDRAIGVLAIGRRARGLVAIGNLACGVIVIGAIAFGGLSVGGGAVGLLALGGGALGAIAIGGAAVGGIAFGGLAVGAYAMGGAAHGLETIDGQVATPAARRCFERLAEVLGPFLPSIRTLIQQRLQ